MLTRVDTNWADAWKSKTFRTSLFTGVAGLLLTLLIWSFWFVKHIGNREGVVLQDKLVQHLPAFDLSIPIFLTIWGMTIFFIFSSIKKPQVFLIFTYSYLLLFLLRMLTIQLVPLNPPPNMVELKDPICNFFYGVDGSFFTKDLFFSGHTATIFLMFLCLEKPYEKTIGTLATIAIAIMVLIQHIHYTIDVLLAPAFSLLVFWVCAKLVWSKKMRHAFRVIKTQ